MKTTNEILKWLKANHGKRATAALTSHDTEALVSAVNLTPLISYREAAPALFLAFGAIVCEMQPGTRWMAYQAIAMELDWGHRSMIWSKAGLSDESKPVCKAAHEPGGTYEDMSKL